jgi:hypothetical protein
MKTLRFAIPAVALLLCASAALAAPDARTSFTALKSLAGNWQGKTSDGDAVQVSYRLTAGGSALMSEIQGMHDDMITMFHLDGDRLLMTHYCAVGNQPRMMASASPDGKVITFDFLDATNLSSPQAGHMHRMVLTMLDPDRHTEEWTFVSGSKETKVFFDLQRAK